MEKLNIYALEGAAFAGKTTLAEYLKKYYSDKIICIPEASEFVGGDKNFPDVPFKTLKDAKASTYFFIEVEKQRCAAAIQANQKTGLPVVMDRTTPISSLIFYSLLRYKDPASSKFITDFYNHAMEAFQVQIDEGNIFVPGQIIYLRPKNKDIFEKRLSRGTKNGVFADWSSFVFLDDVYQKLIAHHYPKDNHLIIETENTQANLENAASEALNFTLNKGSVPLGNVFRNFLGDQQNLKLGVTIQEENEFKESMKRAAWLITNTQNT